MSFCKVMGIGLTAVCLSIGSVTAQESESLVRTYAFKPKAGHAQQFRKAVEDHVTWLRDNGETWSWTASMIATGEKMGTYLFVSQDHTWKDFDDAMEFRAKAGAHWQANVSEHIETSESAVYRELKRHSRAGELSGVPKLATATIYHLNIGSAEPFLETLGELTDVAKENDAPPAIWYQSIFGGQDRVVRVEPMSGWADIPKRQAVMRMLAEEMDEDELKEAFEELGEHLSDVERNVIYFIPELSFQP